MSASVQGQPHGAERPLGKHVRHRSPWSWVLAAVIAAFMAGGIALMVQMWWLFWLSAGVVLLSVPAGRLIRITNRNAPGTPGVLKTTGPAAATDKARDKITHPGTTHPGE